MKNKRDSCYHFVSMAGSVDCLPVIVTMANGTSRRSMIMLEYCRAKLAFIVLEVLESWEDSLRNFLVRLSPDDRPRAHRRTPLNTPCNIQAGRVLDLENSLIFFYPSTVVTLEPPLQGFPSKHCTPSHEGRLENKRGICNIVACSI